MSVSIQSGAQLVLTLLVLIGPSVHAAAAHEVSVPRPMTGEVRMLAVPPTNAKVIARLHHDGWLEARGQLLLASMFPELYQTVGRAWTRDDVPDGRFAVPDLRDRAHRRSSDNPFGVLSPGDLVAAGRRLRTRSLKEGPLSYWIYVGRDASR